MFERVCVTFGLYNRGPVTYIYVPLSSPFPRDIFAFIDECSYCLDGSNGWPMTNIFTLQLPSWSMLAFRQLVAYSMLLQSQWPSFSHNPNCCCCIVVVVLHSGHTNMLLTTRNLLWFRHSYIIPQANRSCYHALLFLSAQLSWCYYSFLINYFFHSAERFARKRSDLLKNGANRSKTFNIWIPMYFWELTCW